MDYKIGIVHKQCHSSRGRGSRICDDTVKGLALVGMFKIVETFGTLFMNDPSNNSKLQNTTHHIIKFFEEETHSDVQH
jgi:hypothetical protein